MSRKWQTRSTKSNRSITSMIYCSKFQINVFFLINWRQSLANWPSLQIVHHQPSVDLWKVEENVYGTIWTFIQASQQKQCESARSSEDERWKAEWNRISGKRENRFECIEWLLDIQNSECWQIRHWVPVSSELSRPLHVRYDVQIGPVDQIDEEWPSGLYESWVSQITDGVLQFLHFQSAIEDWLSGCQFRRPIRNKQSGFG